MFDVVEYRKGEPHEAKTTTRHCQCCGVICEITEIPVFFKYAANDDEVFNAEVDGEWWLKSIVEPVEYEPFQISAPKSLKAKLMGSTAHFPSVSGVRNEY